ncbi:MAG: hypothetical protein HUU54_15490 [Ignavibacteriaceae bacterium]|nr:hypothetical protein [Ignavibacteriaceae bacterium]
MKKLLPALLLTASFFFLQGCSQSNKVKVINFSAQGEVKTSTVITIEFSRDLVSHEMTGEWVDKEYIRFEPRIAGKYKWLSQNKLFFVPDKELEPVSEYEAEITDLVLENSQYSSDFDDYNFHTPSFTLLSSQLYWKNIPNEYYKLAPELKLRFSYPVSPAALKQNLSLFLEGKQLPAYRIVNEENTSEIIVDLGILQQTDKELKLRAAVKSSLRPANGKGELEKEVSFEETLPGIQELRVKGTATGYDGTGGWIEVAFTQPVQENKAKNYVLITKTNEVIDTARTSPSTGEIRFSSDGNILRMETDFSAAQQVKLMLKKGMPGLFGGELKEDYDQELSMTDIEPAINFADKKGRYLSREGLNNIEINAVNISDAELEIIRVNKENIVAFVTQNAYNFNQGEDYYYPYYNTYNLGEQIYSGGIKLENRGNWLERFTVNLKEKMKSDDKGIYVITTRSTDGSWASDTKVLSNTDLGIITKAGKDEIVVFLNSISGASPVNGANVKIFTSLNQTVFEGTTNRDGMVTFRGTAEKLKDKKPFIIAAETKTDYNYLYLDESRIDYSRYDITGKLVNPENYNVFLYSGRDIYRPGESVFISGIVRNSTYRVVADQPVICKILGPGGRVLEEYNKLLNEQGSFEIAYKLTDYAQTGIYVCEVTSGSGTLLDNYLFNVEEFMPEKLRVKVEAEKKYVQRGMNVPVTIDAEYLFGAKAAEMKFDMNVKLRPKIFSSKKFEGYTFGELDSRWKSFEDFSFSGYLDGEGKATVVYTTPEVSVFNCTVEATAWVSVFDLTGRAVNRLTTFTILPDEYFIGLYSPGYYFDVNSRIDFKIAAVDNESRFAPSYSGTVTVIRKEWQTVLRKDYNGRFTYTSQKKEIIESKKDIDLAGGVKTFSFVPSKSGEYEIRVSKNGSANYVSKTIYSYGYGISTASSFQVDKEGRVEIVTDKESYNPGQKAKILITAPFSGRALVTLERDGVISSRYYDLEEKSKEIYVDIRDEYKPNVYLNVTLYRKHTIDQESPFFVAHGIKSLKVERPSDKIPVSISAPAKIKPNTTVDVTVKAGGESGVHITLAAVDEGILQIKDFRTPDPYSGIYAKRQLNVDSYNLYKLLLPELRAFHSSPGGDMMLAEQMKRRINPITSKRIKLVTYWSGIKRTAGDGTVKIRVQVPQYNGDIRFMAVAYKDGRFGSSEKNMKVADNLILEPEIPRTISSEDSLEGILNIVNTTNTAADVNLNIGVSGPVQLMSRASHAVKIQPNGSSRIKYAFKATGGIGEAKITFAAEGFAKVKEEIYLPVKPANPYSVQSGSGTIKPGQEARIKMPSDYWSNTVTTELKISRFPAIKFSRQIKSLLGFPHGCLEQTVSKAFPQLYFSHLAKAAYPEYYKNNNSVYYVKEAIRKVESMQMYDGSMTYWNGGDYSNWWSSVYAAHFLTEAKQAGFSVNEKVQERLLKYLSEKVKQPQLYDRVIYSGVTKTYKKTAVKEILYSLYVLALAGKSEPNIMNYYKARPDLLTMDSKYLLAGAFAKSGKWSIFYELLPKQYKPGLENERNFANFDSPLRADALMLNILLDSDPSNKQIPLMIKHISSSVGEYYNTQEAAFVFLALGKAASRVSENNMKVRVFSGQKEIYSYTGEDLVVTGKDLSSGELKLKGEGKGEVYYFWSSEGIRKSAASEYDSYLSVRRNYYDLKSGRMITDNLFYQGQLIVCNISLSAAGAGAENIAVTDIVPAGFEIENPRLSRLEGLNWSPQSTLMPQYLDVRDDRMVLYTNIEAGAKKDYYYILRAVNKGSFRLPAISANAMYDKEFTSVNGRGRVYVKDIPVLAVK